MAERTLCGIVRYIWIGPQLYNLRRRSWRVAGVRHGDQSTSGSTSIGRPARRERRDTAIGLRAARHPDRRAAGAHGRTPASAGGGEHLARHLARGGPPLHRHRRQHPRPEAGRGPAGGGPRGGRQAAAGIHGGARVRQCGRLGPIARRSGPKAGRSGCATPPRTREDIRAASALVLLNPVGAGGGGGRWVEWGTPPRSASGGCSSASRPCPFAYEAERVAWPPSYDDSAFAIAEWLGIVGRCVRCGASYVVDGGAAECDACFLRRNMEAL